MEKQIFKHSIDLDYELTIGLSMPEVNAEDWNRLAIGHCPFLQHEFLLALESSGSVSRLTGWQPCHIVVKHHEQVIAAMPLYEKHHSYGEYVFDWTWADAYRRYGMPYYPKLVTSIPFTPSQSARLLVDAAYSADTVLSLIKHAIAAQTQLSSWHVLFPDTRDATLFEGSGLIRREGVQYHWFNRGYASFEDFLQACSSRKRKNLRKERESMLAQGIHFELLGAAQISANLWEKFYEFYQNTYEIRGQQGYLTLGFFKMIADTLPDHLFLIMACKDQEYVAGALFFKDSKTLFGRYWGCAQDYQNLHFETCYYQGIEYCINNGLERFDAGAQGEHKLRRGFEPTATTSFHWIADSQFRQAIENFCQQEAGHVTAYSLAAAAELPYKKSG
jgi:predicted N-acyltransferase